VEENMNSIGTMYRAIDGFWEKFSKVAAESNLPEEQRVDVTDYLQFALQHLQLDDVVAAQNALVNAQIAAREYLRN
jgi:hypothetical protein